MAKFEALIEINQDIVKSLAEYISYCKFYFKPKSKDKIKFYEDFQSLQKDFPCVNKNIINDRNYKSNDTLKDFPLNWLKNEIIGKNGKNFSFNNDKSIILVKQISGIYEDLQALQTYINKLPRYSFAIWFKFKLKAPYFSKDDDEFYIIQNPILKETNFKVPMVRGSSWKGAIAGAGKDLINEKLEKGDNVRDYIQSYLRLFGTGSEEFRELEDTIIAYITKNKQIDWKKVVNFLLFELGTKITREDIEQLKKGNEIDKWLREKLWEDFNGEKRELPLFLQVHKGRAIFYPTYFDKLSLEIINPHDRKKRAGKNPIHYEVVPKNTEGIFQLIYIPFDGILNNESELKEEVQKDLGNIIQALEKLQETGIGAKTKLGWGRFEILDKNKKVCTNAEVKIPEGWEKCQG